MMLYYILILLLIFTCFKSESFNQNYIHGQTLSNINKTITDEDVIENPSKSQEYSPLRYFDYILKPSIHIESLEDILKSISNPNINLIDLKHKIVKPFYNFAEINKFLENKINKLSGPLGVFKILDNVGHIYKGLDVDFMKITFNLYNISRSSATPVICYLYKTEGQYIIKEIKFNFIKQPENIMSKKVDIKTDNYDDITYPASLKNKITENIIEENKQTKEYKIKDKYMSQDNIINDSLEYNDLDNTSDIQGVLQRWYNKQ
jgi:hypothetical protein